MLPVAPQALRLGRGRIILDRLYYPSLPIQTRGRGGWSVGAGPPRKIGFFGFLGFSEGFFGFLARVPLVFLVFLVFPNSFG